VDVTALRARIDRRVYLTEWRALDALGGVARQVPDGSVALTFDDGPHPGSTDRLLDLLAGLDVRATFFCVGRNVLAHRALTRRIEAEGHAVGSHSHTHPHPARTTLRELARDYAQGREALADVLGRDSRLFRPPHGHVTPASALLLRWLGLRPWLWTVDPQDWRPGVSRGHVTSVVGGAGSRAVVLMHDWVEQPLAVEATDRSATVEAIPWVVAELRRRGLEPVRLTS
jgi:peptidoglycan/xylan/chitin deacetylase (PgdA/CDA1 family)